MGTIFAEIGNRIFAREQPLSKAIMGK